MKIILINRYLYPDESATSRMTSSLASALAARGFEVVGLASRDVHNDKRQRLPADGKVGDLAIHRLATSRFGRSRLWGRAIDYLSFHVSAALWTLRHARRGDVCVVCTDPPMLSVTLALPLRLKGARLVNWLHDLFPEVALELGVPGAGRFGSIALRLRDWSLARAERNVAPIEAMTRLLGRRGIPARTLTTIRHWADGDGIRPVRREDNALRKEWGLTDKFVVGYSGNFGRAHEFDTILAAAERLKDRADIRFLFIGNGHKRAAVERWIQDHGLDNVVFQAFQPRERLAESLGAADAHLVSLLPPLEPCIIPSKFYGILAAGRPTLFVGDPDGEVARAVAHGDCGHAVAIGDAEGLARHILALQQAPATCDRMAANARRLFEAEYTEARGCTEWIGLMDSLLPQPVANTDPGRTAEPRVAQERKAS
jgi:glycosyltransferase involved in cell wall biosynthesis